MQLEAALSVAAARSPDAMALERLAARAWSGAPSSSKVKVLEFQKHPPRDARVNRETPE